MEKHCGSIVRAKHVIGKDVKSSNLEDIGKVEEIVLDKFTGETRYVVLSFGGFMGLGDDFFAFPWKSFTYNKEEGAYILNVSKDKLKKENGFNKDHWPDIATWSTTVDKYYI